MSRAGQGNLSPTCLVPFSRLISELPAIFGDGCRGAVGTAQTASVEWGGYPQIPFSLSRTNVNFS